MSYPLLGKAFYKRKDACLIARELLGKVIKTHVDGLITRGKIVETEAYIAPDDLACHAHGNRRTERTEVMFWEGGHAYVYICYGIHHLFNVVTYIDGEAHAILIRAVEPIDGLDHMIKRRTFAKAKYTLLNGPGKFTIAMGIDNKHNGISLLDPRSPIVIEDHGMKVSEEMIVSGPRVGMSHHTKACGHYPWRYRISENKWSSKPDKVVYDW